MLHYSSLDLGCEVHYGTATSEVAPAALSLPSFAYEKPKHHEGRAVAASEEAVALIVEGYLAPYSGYNKGQAFRQAMEGGRLWNRLSLFVLFSLLRRPSCPIFWSPEISGMGG